MCPDVIHIRSFICFAPFAKVLWPRACMEILGMNKNKEIKELLLLIDALAEKLGRFQSKGYLASHDKTLAWYRQIKDRYKKYETDRS